MPFFFQLFTYDISMRRALCFSHVSFPHSISFIPSPYLPPSSDNFLLIISLIFVPNSFASLLLDSNYIYGGVLVGFVQTSESLLILNIFPFDMHVNLHNFY